MISVLIPVFNYDVTNLVSVLNCQLEVLDIEYEIICIDDGSELYLKENYEVTTFKNVKYEQKAINLGRSRVRNLLAKKATYNWLLFLDADVIPVEAIFIKKYVNALTNNIGRVFFGGIKNPVAINDSAKMLRWKYGEFRENVAIKIREKNPKKYFLSANFLIQKNLFQQIKFDERIHKYGYEDFLFNEKLKNIEEDVIQLENLVFHNGIESNSVFLSKTKESLENLHFLNKQNFSQVEKIRILSFFNKMETLKLTKFLSKLFVYFENVFESNLKGKKPSLVVFDTYKLCYFCYLQQGS